MGKGAKENILGLSEVATGGWSASPRRKQINWEMQVQMDKSKIDLTQAMSV